MRLLVLSLLLALGRSARAADGSGLMVVPLDSGRADDPGARAAAEAKKKGLELSADAAFTLRLPAGWRRVSDPRDVLRAEGPFPEELRIKPAPAAFETGTGSCQGHPDVLPRAKTGPAVLRARYEGMSCGRGVSPSFALRLRSLRTEGGPELGYEVTDSHDQKLGHTKDLFGYFVIGDAAYEVLGRGRASVSAALRALRTVRPTASP